MMRTDDGKGKQWQGQTQSKTRNQKGSHGTAGTQVITQTECTWKGRGNRPQLPGAFYRPDMGVFYRQCEDDMKHVEVLPVTDRMALYVI